MAVVRYLANRRERPALANERDPVVAQDLFHAWHVRADDFGVDQHQRLMTVADVVSEQCALARRTRPDYEHRLGLLDDAHDASGVIEDEAIAVTKDLPALEHGRELEALIRHASRPRSQALLPSEGQRFAKIADRGRRNGLLPTARVCNGKGAE